MLLLVFVATEQRHFLPLLRERAASCARSVGGHRRRLLPAFAELFRRGLNLHVFVKLSAGNGERERAVKQL